MWPEPAAHGLKGTYSMCPPEMLWSITPLCYSSEEKEKTKPQDIAHICVMLAGSKEKETNLAGCLVWRAWHFGSQGLPDNSESRHKNVSLIRIGQQRSGWHFERDFIHYSDVFAVVRKKENDMLQGVMTRRPSKTNIMSPCIIFGLIIHCVR